MFLKGPKSPIRASLLAGAHRGIQAYYSFMVSVNCLVKSLNLMTVERKGCKEKIEPFCNKEQPQRMKLARSSGHHRGDPGKTGLVRNGSQSRENGA